MGLGASGSIGFCFFLGVSGSKVVLFWGFGV